MCVCKGSDADKLEWFKTINIASVQLKPQELRNAVYTGPWLAAAKKHFSKSNCPAYNKWSKYLTGEMNRQDYLETALKWIADRENCSIEDYMSAHQHDTNCAPLWLYFNAALEWAQTMFPRYRNEMKGLPWGEFYNRYKDNAYDPDEMEKRVKLLRIDDDVTKKKGIYQYLLSGDEKYLSIRKFTVEMSIAAYERQGGICPMCGEHYELEEMQADHIDPWSKGGKTIASNCQMLCASCNRRKSDI